MTTINQDILSKNPSSSTKNVSTYELGRNSLDELLEKIGNQKSHIIVVGLSGLGYFACGAQFTVMAFISESLRSDLNISLMDIATIVGVSNAVAFCSGYFFGQLADRTGRLNSLLLAQLMVLAGAIGSAFVTSFGLFLAMRCVVAFGLGGSQVLDFITLSETVPPSSRARYGQFVFLMGCLGFVYLAICDLSIHERVAHSFGASSSGSTMNFNRWRVMSLIAAAPMMLAFVLRFCLGHETPKYLVFRKKFHQARTVLLGLAGDNKHIVPMSMEFCSDSKFNATHDNLSTCPASPNLEAPEQSHNIPCAVTSIVSTDPPVNANTTSSPPAPMAVTTSRSIYQELYQNQYFKMLAFIWFVQGLTYSGSLIFYRDMLGMAGVGSPKFVFMLMAVSEIPGVLLSGYLSEKYGRAKCLFWFLAAAFCSAILTALANLLESGNLLIACISFLFASHIPVWGLLFTLSPECFDTKIRASAVGILSMCKQIPAAAAPFFGAALIGLKIPSVFMAVWAAWLLSAAVVAFCLFRAVSRVVVTCESPSVH